jgi:hypothetical protein
MPAILQSMRSGSGTQHPQEVINFFSSFLTLTGGVENIENDDFKVEAQDTPDMTVKVNMGRAIVPTGDRKMAYPVRLYSAVYDQDIDSNGSGNPRKDAIVLYIDVAESPEPDIDNVAKITRVAGTPNPSPVAPDDTAIQSAVGASNPFIRLANVTVASGATEIEDADVEDAREDAVLVLNQPTVKSSTQEYVTLTDGATITIDPRKGSKFQVTLGGNRAIVLSTAPNGKDWAGKRFTLRVVQDGGGSRSISSWFSGYTVKWADGVAVTLTSTGGKADKLGFEVLNDGTTIEATIISQNH